MQIEPKNELLVISQNEESRLRYILGRLTKNEIFEFEYDKENIKKLRYEGIRPLYPFPDWEKKYLSKNMFPIFSVRVPDRRRSDIKDILHKYKLDQYDEFELLKKSGGRLPTDSLEFVEPINLKKTLIEREFYIAGVKYNCQNNCDNLSKLEKEMLLQYQLESTNKFDKNAVMILHNGIKLGYIPSYFSNEAASAIHDEKNVMIQVIENNQGIFEKKNCHECIKVKIVIEQ